MAVPGASRAQTVPAAGLPPVVGDRGAALIDTSHEVATRVASTRFMVASTAPAHWRATDFDDRAWPAASGPLVPADPRTPPDGPARPAAPRETAAPPFLYTRTRFDLASSTAATSPMPVRSLELRIAYQDGFVAYLNGREVARRNVPPSPADARPPVAHGADTERIYLALPAPRRGAGAPLLPAGNVLAVEIRPAVGRAAVSGRAPAGEVRVAAFSGARIVRGPYLIAPGDGAISIAWETDLPAVGAVRYEGENDGHRTTRTIPAPLSRTRQVVSLSHLGPGKRYRYWVEVVDRRSAAGPAVRAPAASGVFQSAPAPGQPLRFIVYGDMRAPGHAAHARVVDQLLRENVPLILNTGDLVAVGSEESAWQRYFEITALLGAGAAVVPALGNHEAYVGGAAKSWALFGLRSAAPGPGGGSYSAFDWGGAHFVILDSNQPQEAQRDWLERDLAAAKRRRVRAVFTFCHDGPWSHGPHGGSSTMERDFTPLLAAGGTSVLFSGHDHLYERGAVVTPRGPLVYVVTGGGGAPLYNPTCEPVAPPQGPSPVAPLVRDAGAASATTGAPLPLPPCPSSVAIIRKAYHYVWVEVDADRITICPRQPDGTALEPCTQMSVRSTPPAP